MSDGIIDLTAYLRGRDDDGDSDSAPSRGAFALWGAEGERSRFALPLWRIVYMAGGGRGAVVSAAPGAEFLDPFVVLDLEQDPPRRAFDAALVAPVGSVESPTLRDRGPDEGLSVYLGSHGSRRWYLVVCDGPPRDPLRPRDREDILFLAGECAGLLFLRDFAGEADDGVTAGDADEAGEADDS